MDVGRFLCSMGVCVVLGLSVTGCGENSRTREAAERGDAEAQFELGNTYYFSDGLVQSDVEAGKWWRKAAEQGHTEAQYWLGWLYASGWGVEKNPAEAAKWNRRAAAQGYSRAFGALAWMYTEGLGVEKDLVEAYRWRALDVAGIPESQAELDELGAQMSSEEVSEAKRRVAAFKPRNWEEVQAEEREAEKK